MKTITGNLLTGLLFTLFFVMGGSALHAQILKNVTNKVNDASTTATDPIKDTRNAVRDIGQTPRDISNAKQDITRPVDDIQREVDGLKNDVNSTKNDINNMRGQKNADRDAKAKQDSLAAADKAAQQAQYEAEKARADSIYQSKLRTGKDMGSNKPATTTEVVTSDQSRTVLLPPSTIKGVKQHSAQPATRTRTRTRTGTYSGTTRTGTTRTGTTQAGTTRTGTTRTGTTRTTVTSGGNSASSSAGGSTRPATSASSPASSRSMRYANTPAKRYLERADFDEETLKDLFEAAIWTGPDSVHTARSIDYMLQQYRMDLDEVKRIDPNFDIEGREDRYRKWSGLYYRNTRPLKED